MKPTPIIFETRDLLVTALPSGHKLKFGSWGRAELNDVDVANLVYALNRWLGDDIGSTPWPAPNAADRHHFNPGKPVRPAKKSGGYTW